MAFISAGIQCTSAKKLGLKITPRNIYNTAKSVPYSELVIQMYQQQRLYWQLLEFQGPSISPILCQNYIRIMYSCTQIRKFGALIIVHSFLDYNIMYKNATFNCSSTRLFYNSVKVLLKTLKRYIDISVVSWRPMIYKTLQIGYKQNLRHQL